MRKAYLLLVLAPAALVWACGGSDDSISGDGGGNDATTDGNPQNDTGTTDGSSDAAKTDGATDAGQDVSITITCIKPADCIDGGNLDAAYPPDSGEVCCGTVQTAGTFPNCAFNAASTTCAAPSACATSIGLQSCGTDTVRLCSADSECTEMGTSFTTYNKCCSATYQDAGRVHFCSNTTIANLSQGSITCP